MRARASDPTLRWFLYAFPSRFREVHGNDLEDLYADMVVARGRHLGATLEVAWDMLRNGLAARVDDLRASGRRRLLARHLEMAAMGDRKDRAGVIHDDGASRTKRTVEPYGVGSHGTRSRDDSGDRGFLDSVVQDLVFAARLMRRSPGFATIAILSLALGIGANTALFSALNAALLRPLPVHDPHELVVLHFEMTEDGWPQGMGINGWLQENERGLDEGSSFALAFLEAARRPDTGLDEVFGFANFRRVSAAIDGSAEVASAQVVSGNYYRALGIGPTLGRLLDEADDDPGAPAATVISHGFWMRRFGGERTAVGKVVSVNGTLFTIVGIGPAGFRGTLQVGDAPDFTVPLRFAADDHGSSRSREAADYWWLHLMGRLTDGATVEGVDAALSPVFQAHSRESLPEMTEERVPELRIIAGARGMTERREGLRQPLGILTTVVALVLLIACANLANLLLARSSTRQHEIAVRLSLGAKRSRLIRQLLTESMVLALIGGTVGVWLAYQGRTFLLGIVMGSGSFDVDLGPDLRMLAFTLFVSLVTGLTFGITPALRATRVDLTPALKGARRGTVGTERKLRTPRAFMVAQVAMSLVLLVASGLFVRTLQNLQAQATGFNPEGVLLFDINPVRSGYDPERAHELYRGASAEILRLPGVRAVGIAAHSPVSGSMSATRPVVEGHEPDDPEQRGLFVNLVDPRFLGALQIPIVAGRGFTAEDLTSERKVAIVNETFVRRWFGDESPIGWLIGLEDEEPPNLEIIGVARDVQYANLDSEQWAAAHVPYTHAGDWMGEMTFAVRAAGEPADLGASVRRTLQRLDAELPLYNVRTQQAQRDATLVQERQFARVSTFLGIVALALACIGLYGILSYSVVRRTREIGVRIALGARGGDLVRMMLAELRPVMAGIVLGVVAALVGMRWLQSLLYGLSPTDPVTLAGAVVILAMVAVAAAWIPARRAARVDPAVALRLE